MIVREMAIKRSNNKKKKKTWKEKQISNSFPAILFCLFQLCLVSNAIFSSANTLNGNNNHLRELILLLFIVFLLIKIKLNMHFLGPFNRHIKWISFCTFFLSLCLPLYSTIAYYFQCHRIVNQYFHLFENIHLFCCFLRNCKFSCFVLSLSFQSIVCYINNYTLFILH